MVLDCTGTYGQPRWLGEGGIPAIGETAARAQVAGGLEDILGKDRPKYAGKTMLVVGGGYYGRNARLPARELAAAHPEQWTIWLARGPRSTPLPRHPNDPFRERDRLAAKANMLACRGEGNVEFHAGSTVESIVTHGPDKGFTVTAHVAGKADDLERGPRDCQRRLFAGQDDLSRIANPGMPDDAGADRHGDGAGETCRRRHWGGPRRRPP